MVGFDPMNRRRIAAFSHPKFPPLTLSKEVISSNSFHIVLSSDGDIGKYEDMDGYFDPTCCLRSDMGYFCLDVT